jgi:hypothetical protein
MDALTGVYAGHENVFYMGKQIPEDCRYTANGRENHCTFFRLSKASMMEAVPEIHGRRLICLVFSHNNLGFVLAHSSFLHCIWTQVCVRSGYVSEPLVCSKTDWSHFRFS